MVDHRKTSYAPDTSLADVKSQLALCTPRTKVTYVQASQIAAEAIVAQDALTQTLSKLNDIAVKKADTRIMTETSDYRNELALRDEQLKREMDIRHESSKLEQAIRDKSLDDRLTAFIATQAEREKALDNQLAGFYAAQAERDKTLDERLKGFHATQAERDKRLDETVADIKSEITKLGSLKLNIWGAMLSAIGILVAIAALSLTFYQTGKADSQPPVSSSQAATQSSTVSPPASK